MIRYHDKLQELQNEIFSDQEVGWMLQCAELIPKKPNYVYVPSFCGLSIPLNSPGYSHSIVVVFPYCFHIDNIHNNSIATCYTSILLP